MTYPAPSTDTGPDIAKASGRPTAAIPRLAVSVVVPCYNESESVAYLGSHLQRLRDEGAEDYQFEFLLVDDGSSDDTWEQLNRHFGNGDGFRLLQHSENRGLTAAIFTGIDAADHEIVCSIDSDCTYAPVLLLDMIPWLDDDVAIVTASPYHPDGEVRNVPAWRIWLSRRASQAYELLLHNQINCYTCAFRVYRRSLLKSIRPDCHGFTGTAELVWKASRQGYPIIERPAVLEVRKFGQSKMRTASVALRHMKLLSRILVSRFSGSAKSS